jgi:hypothetical protein
MDTQTLNHRIATEVFGWTHLESIVYQDKNEQFCYLADYCNSLPHACDLAMAMAIGIIPLEDGVWQAYQLTDTKIMAKDKNLATAIVMAVLAVGQA